MRRRSVGLSTSSGAFTNEVIEVMSGFNHRPIIFPLSNPVKLSECTYADALHHSRSANPLTKSLLTLIYQTASTEEMSYLLLARLSPNKYTKERIGFLDRATTCVFSVIPVSLG